MHNLESLLAGSFLIKISKNVIKNLDFVPNIEYNII